MNILDSRKKFFITFCFILLNAFLIVGFLVIRDATSLNQLKKEMNELTKLNVTTDRFNRKIKTTGGYAAVEISIKEYLDGYAVGVQDINSLVHDPQLSKILSYENYLEDGPDFKNSIDQLLEDLEEDHIMEHIHTRTNDTYYVSLYEQLMLDGEINDELYQSKDLFSKTKVQVNSIYDTSLAILNFLIAYDGSWKLEDGQIKFANDELCQYYNSLIAKVETKKGD